MADGCLEYEASMYVWLAFSCRGESVTTYIESVQKSQQCQTLNANIFLQRLPFLIHLFFHALSTGLNTIDIQKMTWKCRYISRKIVFRLDLLSPVDRAWKKQVDFKKSKSLAVFWRNLLAFKVWHFWLFFVQIPCKTKTSSCTVSSSTVWQLSAI